MIQASANSALPPADRLLDAAAELMYARGYEAVGVAELCARADTRKGSFYYWWPSKQALAIAMLERAWARNLTTLFEPAFDQGGSVLSRFEHYGELLVAQLKRNAPGPEDDASGSVKGCRFGNFAVELSARDEAIREKVAAVFDQMRDIFADALRDGIASGELCASLDPDDLADAVISHAQGLMVLAKARNDPNVLGRLGRDVARLCRP